MQKLTQTLRASKVTQCSLLSMLFLFSTVTAGASFDCKTAGTRVERLICSNSNLSSLDDALAEIFTTEMETEANPDLRSSQKAWLAVRNNCKEASCIQHQYEQRIAELSCNPLSILAGTAIGAGRCSNFSLRLQERELSSIEERYGKMLADNTDNPGHTASVFKNERSAWRSYRAAQCALYGATEGGSDSWKNAFATMCEADETKKRIARMKTELGRKE